jgi:hypothetical protein
MADRIIGMRKALRENLENLGSPLSWQHVTNQVNSGKCRYRIFEYDLFMQMNQWNGCYNASNPNVQSKVIAIFFCTIIL